MLTSWSCEDYMGWLKKSTWHIVSAQEWAHPCHHHLPENPKASGFEFSGLPRKAEPTRCVNNIYLDVKELAGASVGLLASPKFAGWLAVTLEIAVGGFVAVLSPKAG